MAQRSKGKLTEHFGLLMGIGLLLACSTASADNWIAYTDGRVGGCFLNNSGFMFGCTPQPPAPAPPARVQRDVLYVPTRDPQQDASTQQAQQENVELRTQLGEARRREKERDDAEIDEQQRSQINGELERRRAEREASLAWLATPEGQAQLDAANRAASAQRQAEIDRMKADQEAIRAKPRSKARQEARGMSSCSRAGGVYTCSNVGCLCD